LSRIADELMLTVDPTSFTLSQIMIGYHNSIVLDNINENIEPMDISDILIDAGNNLPTQTYLSPLTKQQQAKERDNIEYDFEHEFGFVINAPNGRGSLLLYSAGCKMRRAGLPFDQLSRNLHKINSMWTNPMPTSRLNKIINQFKGN